MLLSSWDISNARWKYKIGSEALGSLKDDSSQRHYVGCLDQIERTERMLKQRWREINQPQKNDDYHQFIAKYHSLDRLSYSSRESAGITIQALLGIEGYRRLA